MFATNNRIDTRAKNIIAKPVLVYFSSPAKVINDVNKNKGSTGRIKGVTVSKNSFLFSLRYRGIIILDRLRHKSNVFLHQSA